MKNLLKLIFILISFAVIYIVIIYLFPDLGYRIDKNTETDFNKSIINKTELFLGKVSESKESTDNFIDNVGKNSKEKSIKQKENINEIINQ